MPSRRIWRLLFIVGQNRRALHDSLRRTFAGDDTVQVLFDRRVTERRRGKGRKRPTERRARERRLGREVERQIRARGYAVVGVPTAHTQHKAR